MDILFSRTKDQLAKARETYGNSHQLLVSIEELNELAGVLTKYGRYITHERAVQAIREKVIDECGDVLNSLDHIQAIFGISDQEIVEAAARKGDRVQVWLNRSDHMEITMTERAIPQSPCPMCMYDGADPMAWPCYACHSEPGYKGFTPKKYT